jgi:hypothetical protein
MEQLKSFLGGDANRIAAIQLAARNEWTRQHGARRSVELARRQFFPRRATRLDPSSLYRFTKAAVQFLRKMATTLAPNHGHIETFSSERENSSSRTGVKRCVEQISKRDRTADYADDTDIPESR